MIQHHTDIHSYIKDQESNYKKPIQLNDVWSWSMYDHIKRSFLYIHSQTLTGKDDSIRVKNITKPILNVQHRTEDIELKDVQIYVDDPDKYHMSFLVKKYHDDVFVREHDLDTFFDDLNVSRIDYGAGLSKRLASGREVVDLQSIVFCDQTDILSGPIGIKHYYSPDQLLEMAEVGWGEESNGATISLEALIELSRDEKTGDLDQQTSQTPGRYIEVYETHGNLPKMFFDKSDTSGKYETRIVISAFYKKKNSTDPTGVILYSAVETKSPFKVTKRDKVFGRALGFGGAEELFESQVGVTSDMMRKEALKDSASKTIFLTNDPAFSQRNDINDLDNNAILEEAEGGNTRQLDTYPRNIALFEKSIADWEAHAQQMGAANDSIMGQAPTAGTPFKLQELVTQESHGLHEYRRGQFAKHIEEIYYDDFIPQIQREITAGAKFLSELSLEDMQYVSDAIVTKKTNDMIKERILDGQPIPQEEIDAFKQMAMEDFKKGGNKKFIDIVKGEFKGLKFGVKVSVAGKSKNLSQFVDKLTNIFRTIMANPALLQNPAMAGLWNQIIEASGLDPVDFSNFEIPQAALPQAQPAQPAQPPTQLAPA